MTFRRVRLTDGQEHIVYDDLICKLPLRAEAVRRRYREIYKEACTCRKWVEIVKGLRRQVIPQAARNRCPSSGYSLFLGRVPLPGLCPCLYGLAYSSRTTPNSTSGCSSRIS